MVERRSDARLTVPIRELASLIVLPRALRSGGDPPEGFLTTLESERFLGMTRNPHLVEWHPASWHGRPAQQQPTYPDQQALHGVIAQLGKLPPLVASWEIEALKGELAEAQAGERFVCSRAATAPRASTTAESEPIAAKLKILLQMSLVLVHGTRKPVVRIGRIAGQYAKPRSADTETRGDVTLPAYRGDIINRDAFTAADREPDPRC